MCIFRLKYSHRHMCTNVCPFYLRLVCVITDPEAFVLGRFSARLFRCFIACLGDVSRRYQYVCRAEADFVSLFNATETLFGVSEETAVLFSIVLSVSMFIR